MSRWLGMRASSPPQEVSTGEKKVKDGSGPVDFVPDKVARNMEGPGQLPRRRQSSEMTVAISDSSRRESLQKGQDQSSSSASSAVTPEDVVTRLGSSGGAAASSGGGSHDGTAEFTYIGENENSGEEEDDAEWEEIVVTPTDSGITTPRISSPLQQCRHDHLDVRRPLSPGVDFFMVLPKHGASVSVLPSAADEEELAVTVAACTEHDREPGRDRPKWVDARSSHSFLVRGPTYLTDKGKRPAGTAMCRLLDFDCFAEGSSEHTRIDHIASRGRCREKVEALTTGDNAPFLFVMNIQVRGNPPVSMVAYWAVDRKALASPDDVPDPQQRTFTKIVASYADIPMSTFGGSKWEEETQSSSCPLMDETPPPPHSDERNQRFKLIPRVIGGSWVIRKSVGSTPVLLGTKIHHSGCCAEPGMMASRHGGSTKGPCLPIVESNFGYYRGAQYVETDMDTGSSTAAASLCSRCRGLSRKLDVDLGIVLQANSAEELPEALLGAVRLTGFGVEDPALQTNLF